MPRKSTAWKSWPSSRYDLAWVIKAVKAAVPNVKAIMLNRDFANLVGSHSVGSRHNWDGGLDHHGRTMAMFLQYICHVLRTAVPRSSWVRLDYDSFAAVPIKKLVNSLGRFLGWQQGKLIGWRIVQMCTTFGNCFPSVGGMQPNPWQPKIWLCCNRSYKSTQHLKNGRSVMTRRNPCSTGTQSSPDGNSGYGVYHIDTLSARVYAHGGNGHCVRILVGMLDASNQAWWELSKKHAGK